MGSYKDIRGCEDRIKENLLDLSPKEYCNYKMSAASFLHILCITLEISAPLRGASF